jgi:hypothetical protein
VNIEYKDIIEKWMLTTYRADGIEKFDDLHIDKIDEVWIARPLWIEGGLEAFRLAIHLRDRHKLSVEVGLAFSLNAGEKRSGVNFETMEELAERFDSSPPSLYLLRANDEPSRHFSQ